MVRTHPIRALLGAAFLAVSAILLWTAFSLPDVSGLAAGWPDTTAYMELRIDQARDRGEHLETRYDPVPLSRIPSTLQRAVLVSEDAAFYGHSAFDWFEVKAALADAWREKRLPRGASTITQQLARNLYLSPSQTVWRKFREALIARRLEEELSKGRILELYLNVIELGPGIFGVNAASKHYFGVPVDLLDRRQAAALAATIPSPRADNPATATREFRWRSDLAYRRAFGGEGDRIEVAAPEPPEVRPPELDATEPVSRPSIRPGASEDTGSRELDARPPAAPPGSSDSR